MNEKRLSSITELTTLEDKPIKIIDTGQRDKDRDKDNRDREREWNYNNKKQNHITNNHHQQSVPNHTSHVSIQFSFLFGWGIFDLKMSFALFSGLLLICLYTFRLPITDYRNTNNSRLTDWIVRESFWLCFFLIAYSCLEVIYKVKCLLIQIVPPFIDEHPNHDVEPCHKVTKVEQ